MARAIPTVEPQSATAGDLWSWEVAFADFPADTSDLRYSIVGKKDSLKWDPTWVTESGTSFLVVIPKTETAKLKGGGYRLYRTLESDAGDRMTEELPLLTVHADPTTLTALRTPDEKLLEEIDAGLLAFAESSATKLWMIDGRQVMREDLDKLRSWRTEVVNRIRAARGGPFATQVLFSYPGVR